MRQVAHLIQVSEEYSIYAVMSRIHVKNSIKKHTYCNSYNTIHCMAKHI